MSKQRHTAEQIIGKLREAEVLQAKGMTMEEVMRQLGAWFIFAKLRFNPYWGI